MRRTQQVQEETAGGRSAMCALCISGTVTRILHSSKAFRRMKDKTQVFLAPGDHYRNRHTLEVSQIARTHSQGAASE